MSTPDRLGFSVLTLLGLASGVFGGLLAAGGGVAGFPAAAAAAALNSLLSSGLSPLIIISLLKLKLKA
ncbi:hypothetical protein [Zhongshania guokunii]|uniref:hypothetical protein n=1 Tax=Zhongshania guokunii TaxID=641783 RepID=UPI0034A0D549